MAETEAAPDPRLMALGLAQDLVVEFEPGIVEIDMVNAPPVEAPPVTPAAPVVAPSPAVRPRPVIAATSAPAPAPLVIEPPRAIEPPREQRLAESALLLRTDVVIGPLARAAELDLETLGFRIRAAAIEVAWSDVREITARRGRVRVRATDRTIDLTLPIDGIPAPELSEAFAMVMREVAAGTFQRESTAFHDLQNATDALHDRFYEGDDPFIPTVLGLVLVAASVVLAFALPEILFFVTRPAVPSNAFLLSSRMAPFDPRVVIVAVAGAATVSSVAAHLALGEHAGAWARGTLRGWHSERAEIVRQVRRGLALVVRAPAVCAAALVIALAIAVPSARQHATVDVRGLQVFRPLPPLDRITSWADVKEIVPIAAADRRHPDGFAVLIRSADGATLTTNDLLVQNGSDRYFYDMLLTWVPSLKR